MGSTLREIKAARTPGSDRGQALHVDAIHAALRDAIVSGELPQGAILSQVQLAKQLGVSRTPLREAVRLLQAEGFVEATPNQRIRIPTLSVAELEQLYTLRIAVESVAIRVSVPRFGDRDFEHLWALTRSLERCAAARDVDGWEVPHQTFHRSLIAHAGDRVTGLAGRLQESSKRYRRMYVTQGPRAWWHTTTEHTAILSACEDRDAPAAAWELARHYARTALTVIALIDPEHDPASVRAAVALASPSQSEPRVESLDHDAIGLRALGTGAKG